MTGFDALPVAEPVDRTKTSFTQHKLMMKLTLAAARWKIATRDCNPGLEFSIPAFGIVEFPMPRSRRDWRSIVKTTKIAKWVTVFGSLFLNYKCVRSCYGFSSDVL